MNVLVTGATGFVGRAVVPRLLAAGHRVRVALRSDAPPLPGVDAVVVGDIDGHTEWTAALDGIDAVVHLAARVHRPGGTLADFRRVNRDGTARLARSCRRGQRFVLMSSIRAVVDESHPTAIDERTVPRPTTPYGISKLEAEAEVHTAAHELGLSWIALRPPLVLGEGVGGNLRRLMGLVRHRVPLPLAAVHNRRSTIYVGNLADAVARALEPGAPSGVAQPLCDGPPHSTATLVREIGAAMTRRARLLPVPPRWLELAARTIGRTEMWRRLCGDLEIVADDLRDGVPAVSFSEAIRRSVHAYLSSRPSDLASD